MKAAHAMKDHNGRPFGSLFASICENAVLKKRLGKSYLGRAAEAMLRDIAVTLTGADLAGAYYRPVHILLASACSPSYIDISAADF